MKDIQELEELISEIKIKGEFSEFEFEFIHSRAKGLLSLMSLLKSQDGAIPDIQKEKIQSGPKVIREEETIKAEVPFVENNIQAEEEKIEVVEEKEIVKEEEDKTETTDSIEKEPVATPIKQKLKEEASTEVSINSNQDLEEEEIEEEEIKPTTLGESFSSEKSLNDMISESKKNVQNSISNRPVSRLQSAVGINDRFLFIRELFNGDGDLYTDAINNLDKMNSIQDAVTYLRDNYKWKKNDTSLKFIDLVKRRFANE